MPNFMEFVLTHEILEEAQTRADLLPEFLRSMRGPAANQVGCIGEIIFEKFLNKNSISYKDTRNDTRKDYIIGNKNITIDVKTKDRTARPQRHYQNSIPLYNHDHQKPDYYAFISLLRPRHDFSNKISRFTHAFLVGFSAISSLDTLGTHMKKGQIDPSNGMTIKMDCINIEMRDLIPYDVFLNRLNDTTPTDVR